MEGRNDSGNQAVPDMGMQCPILWQYESLKSIRPFHYNGDTL
jgi:hypothetical protein